jgi:hypothetical protein
MVFPSQPRVGGTLCQVKNPALSTAMFHQILQSHLILDAKQGQTWLVHGWEKPNTMLTKASLAVQSEVADGQCLLASLADTY